MIDGRSLMGEAAVQVSRLSKKYPRVEALKEVSLAVQTGMIYGLLGRNGAGKTTLVKILLGIVHPSSGEATLLGGPCHRAAVRRRVGYLPEDHRLPEYHTAASILTTSGLLHGMSPQALRSRSAELLELVGLKEWARSKIGSFSKGMRQRLALAQALLHDPELIFLDEPTDGVDPVGRREIRDTILRLKDQGRTVFINSHLLSEVEVTCDRVAILEAGRLVREGDIAEMTRVENRYELRLVGPVQEILTEVMAIVEWARPVEGGLEVQVQDPRKIDAVIDFLRARNIGIRGLYEKTNKLEDVFLKTIGAEEGQGEEAA
jgi:ABC-2 type transport system ATP-binding protein